MSTKQIELLQDQAWFLLESFHKLETSLFDSPDFDMDLFCRIDRIHRIAYQRWSRRCQKHLSAITVENVVAANSVAFSSYPDGFALSPVLPSGALGQGAI